MRPSYAAIGIYLPGSTRATLISVRGRVVVFDHAEQARQYLPLLGGGRPTRWQSPEQAYWLPINPRGINRACVLTDYDPYQLPPGLPVLSESRGQAWRAHVHAAYVFHDCGQMRREQNGNWTNEALES